MERIELLKHFLEEDPGDHFSLYALALEYAKINRVGEAIVLLEQLLDLDPAYLAAYYQLGKLFELQRNIERAFGVFSKGMEVARQQKNQKTLNELQSALELLDE
jgi:tetratricopeptide (TPR) repeat protein